MVQRLSWEEVLLSTFTDSSLIAEHHTSEVLIFAFPNEGLGANLAQQSNDRSGDGCDDQQQHHHGHWTVLVLVV